jgi:hypothetical protein
MNKEEMLRRLRLGDLKRFLRDRYGHTLPDDDAGRADLYELLLPASLGVKSPVRIMRNMIETWAPWMSKDEADALIEEIENLPPPMRKKNAQVLGKLLGLTLAERSRLNIRTIAADVSDDEKAAHTKAKRREQARRRQVKRRRKTGKKSRAAYLAGSVTAQKPWLAEGISRASWYRRNSAQSGETGPSRNKHLHIA